MVESGVVVPKNSRRFTARFARFSLLILTALSASLLASAAAQAADATAPRIVSIERNNPTSSITAADVLVWRVTFDEPVQNVTTGDFTISGTTATIFDVTNNSTTESDIAVRGGDLNDLNATVTLAVAGGQDIQDLAGNALSNTTPTGTTQLTFDIDNTAPFPTAISRNTPATENTDADTLVFDLTFSESVAGVGADDYTITGTTATGVIGGSGADLTLTLSGGDLASLNGTVSIEMVEQPFVFDLAGNLMVITDPTVTNENSFVLANDQVAPTLLSIVRQSPATTPTNADSVTWRFTFDEAVTNIDAADFDVQSTTATIQSVTNTTGNSWDVVVSGGDLATLNGSIAIGFDAGQNVTDLAGNAYVDAAPSGAYEYDWTLDNTAPRLDTISASQTYTNSDSLTFRATFDGAVSNVSADDFAIGGTTATVTSIVVNSSSDYSLTVSGGDLASIDNTTVTIALSGGQDIADAAGNALTDTSPTGYIDEVYVNNTLPVGTFTSAAAAPVAQPFTVNLAFTPQAGFADNILGLTQSDIVVGNGTIESFTFTTAGGGVTTGVDIVVRPTADGAVTLDLPENSIIDEAENQNPAATQFSINADVTVPTINIFKAGAPCPCDGPITVTIALSEGGITGFDINDLVVTGGTLSNFSFVNSGSVTLTPTADGTMTLQIPAGSMTDADGFGNLESNLFSADFDTTRPTVTLTTAAAAPVTGEFDLDITFSEPLTNVGNTSAWTLTNGSRLSVTGSGANYVMRVRPQSGAQGTLTLDLAENGFSDAAGNGVVAPAQFSIAFDRANPRIASVERFSPSDATTNADSLTFTVTFSEDVSNVDAADFDIYTSDFAPANTTATITNVTPVSASVYRVTVSGGNLGSLNSTTITLNGRTDGNILDAVGNVMSIGSPQTTPEAYTMDNAAPLLNSFARQTPADEQTNADSLVWLVTFSETALNVDAADFDVSGSTAGVSNVSALVAGSAPPGIAVPLANLVSNQYLVTVSGGDLADLDAEVGLDLAPGQNISDSAGNTVANSEPATDETYDVRNSAPLIASITRSTPSASPTNADSLTWRLTFAQIDNAFDLPANAFTVTGTTATVTDVSRFSVGFDVTVSGGDLADLTGDVTLGLTNSDFADDYGNVMDRTIPGGAELTYSVDNTAPSGHSVSFDPSPINAANQTAIGVDFANFEVGGSLTYTVTSSGGAGSLSGGFAVPVANGSFPPQDASALPDGTITLSVIHTDAVGNEASTVTATTTKDTVAPTLAITGPAGPVSGAFTATFTFSEAILGFDVSEITVGNGAASNLQPVVAAGDGISGPSSNPTAATYTATITPAANGDVTLDVSAGVATDSVGNGNTAATQFSVTNDETAPLLASIARNTPATEQTDADTLVFAITFDESVSNVSADDFDITGTTATGVLAGSGASYTLTLSGGDLTNLNGVVGLDVAAGQDITDLAGNAFAGAEPSTDETYNVLNDTIAPRVASIERYSPTEAVTYRAQLHWRVTFSEDVTGLDATDFAVTGTTGTLSTSVRSDHVYVTVAGGDMSTLNGVVTLSFAAGQDIADTAGNSLTDTAPTGANEASYTVDNVRPRVASIERYSPTEAVTYRAQLHWRVSFNKDVTGLDATDFAVTGTTGTISTSVRSDHVYVTVAGGDMSTLNGVVTLSFAPGQDIADAAGNTLNNTAPTGANEASYTVDNTRPLVASIERYSPTEAVTQRAQLHWQVTFNEDVSDLDVTDFAVAGTTGTLSASVRSDHVYVTVAGGDMESLNGVVTLSFAAGQNITDVAGNALNNTVPTGANEASYTVDNTRPLVASIERDTPTTELTNADSLVWAVHFNENVTDIDAADFAVSGTTGVVANVSPLAVGLPPSVAGDGISLPFVVSSSAFLVTASGGDMSTLNGVVTLSFAGNQNIADEAGNLLFDTSPTGANEASFTLDNAAPTLALTTTATAPVSAPFTLTATFSEDVTGFELGDLVVGNGTASGFQAVSATIYTVSITPGPGPAVTLDVTAGAAVDVAGNDSVAASQLSISHDPDRTLTVSLPGVGSGTVTSAPTGIDCGTDCSEDYALGSSVTLTAAADAGSSFAGWTAGPCTGSSAADCAVTINAETNVAARFTLDTPPAGRIVAATLPGARSGYVGGPVITAFLSVVSRTSSPAQSCQVAAPPGAPVTLTYRQLDGAGMPIGPDSPLFDIDAGGTLSFILAMTATAQTGAGGYSFLPVITCENASLDPIVGVNDVLLNIGAAPTPDLLAVNATPSGDGVIRIPGPGRVQLMTASVLNNGVGDGSGAANEVTLTTTVDTGAAVLPLSLEICQINASAICLTPRSASITSTMTGTDPLFFAVFVRDTSTGGIAFDPANSRVFLRFADATGTIRSTTSAAVTAPAPAAAPEITASLPTGRWSVLMRQPDGVWPGLVRTTLYVMEDGRVLVDDGTAPRLSTMAAATAGSDAEGGFVAHGSIGLWTTEGTIRLGGPWVEQTGEFWGVRDARTNAEARWSDLAGAFGESLFVSETGEIRGTIGGCGVYGQATGFATRAVSLSLSGCAQSGSYLGQIDLPANDNDAPALLIANGSHGWRVER